MSIQQEKFKAIADRIRAHTDTEDLIKPSEFADKIDYIAGDKYSLGKTDGFAQGHEMGYAGGYSQGEADGIEQGRQAVYDEFWDEYQKNGTRINYEYAFSGNVWNDETFKPKHKMKPQSCNYMFLNSKIVDARPLDNFITNWSSNYGVVAMCQDCKSLKYVGSIGAQGGSFQSVFYGCTNLVSVDKLHIGANCSSFYMTFYNCSKLTDITFSGTIKLDLNMQYSPLNKASIESVIGCLSATATGKTLTLKKSAVNNAFGINVDDTTTYPEGSEYYVLRHSRDNWNISYL